MPSKEGKSKGSKSKSPSKPSKTVKKKLSSSDSDVDSTKKTKKNGKELIKQGSSSGSLRKGDVRVKKPVKAKEEAVNKKSPKANGKAKAKTDGKSSPKKSKKKGKGKDVSSNVAGSEIIPDSDKDGAEKMVPIEDPEMKRLRLEAKKVQCELARQELLVSLAGARVSVARGPPPPGLSWSEISTAIKNAQNHWKSKVMPCLKSGALYDFTVVDCGGCEERVSLEGPRTVLSRSPGARRGGKPLSLPLSLRSRGDGVFNPEFWKEVLAVCGAAITVYLIELLVGMAVCLILGFLFVPALVMNSREYAGHNADPRLVGSVACLPPELVFLDSNSHCISSLIQASVVGSKNISDFSSSYDMASCHVQYLSDCPLPVWSVVGDLIGTVLLSICLLVALLLTSGGGPQHSLQSRLKVRLNMEIPNAKDFTLQVSNPPPDATDPSEWFQFFNKRGKVQNVTVSYDNKKLVALVLKKRKLLRHYTVEDIKTKQLQHKKELTPDEALLLRHMSCSPLATARRLFNLDTDGKDVLLMRDLCAVNKQIYSLIPQRQQNKEEMKPHPPHPCSVYVTFEHQAHVSKCMTSSRRFRGKHSLVLKRPPEPEALRWQHLRSNPPSCLGLRLRQLVGWLMLLLIVACACFALLYVEDYCSKYWGVAFLIVDFLLPISCRRLVALFENYHETEDARQHSLFVKLTMARILSLSILMYASTSWEETLEEAQLITQMNTQLLICVVVPVIQAMDPVGFYYRWFKSSGHSKNQDEFDYCWEPSSDFILAEHYSRVLSTSLMCLLYAIVTPISLLVLLVSLFVTFFSDYYVLARKHNIVLIFRSHMANSFNIGLLVTLFIHVCVSSRIVYSWPFDEAYVNDDGLIETADKAPPLLLWRAIIKPWHTDLQTLFLVLYLTVGWALALCLLGVVIVKRCNLWALKEWIRARVVGSRRQACYRDSRTAITYSGVHVMSSYCPVIREDGGRELLLNCDTSEMLPRYLPVAHCKFHHESANLTDHVPAEGVVLFPRMKSFPFNMYSKFPILYEMGVYNSSHIHNETAFDDYPHDDEKGHCTENEKSVEEGDEAMTETPMGINKAEEDVNREDFNIQLLADDMTAKHPSTIQLGKSQGSEKGEKEAKPYFYDITRRMNGTINNKSVDGVEDGSGVLGNGSPLMKRPIVGSSQIVSIDYTKRNRGSYAQRKVFPLEQDIRPTNGYDIDLASSCSVSIAYSRDQDSIGLLRL